MICRSQHSDTLIAYILHELQKSKSSKDKLQAKDIKDPKMLKITSKAFTLSYVDRASNVQNVRTAVSVRFAMWRADCDASLATTSDRSTSTLTHLSLAMRKSDHVYCK